MPCLGSECEYILDAEYVPTNFRLPIQTTISTIDTLKWHSKTDQGQPHTQMLGKYHNRIICWFQLILCTLLRVPENHSSIHQPFVYDDLPATQTTGSMWRFWCTKRSCLQHYDHHHQEQDVTPMRPWNVTTFIILKQPII